MLRFVNRSGVKLVEENDSHYKHLSAHVQDRCVCHESYRPPRYWHSLSWFWLQCRPEILKIVLEITNFLVYNDLAKVNYRPSQISNILKHLAIAPKKFLMKSEIKLLKLW